MSSSYENAVARMYALGHELVDSPPAKFDLKYMRILLAGLNNPEQRFPSVLIAGTNGKGSTAATLASILRASGLRTGLYTSPHLLRINERIRINGQEIADEKFALLHDLVERTVERLIEDHELPWHPSFFEMITAIAFEHFSTSRLDIAVLEVGMGGRLDATNVVDPRLSVITDISFDHEKYLGNTLTEIAREKAGIIRAHGTVVTLPQSPEANDVIGMTILEKGARAVNAARYVPAVTPASPDLFPTSERPLRSDSVGSGQSAPSGTPIGAAKFMLPYPVEVSGRKILVESRLPGRHQLRNVALAIATAEELARQGLPVTPESIAQGIRETEWPGRFQVIPASPDSREYVLDVAHNPAGAWALRSTLSACYENRSLIYVFGAMRDKAIREITEILFPLADYVVATRAENPRSSTPEEIRHAAARTHTEIVLSSDVGSALKRAGLLGPPDAVVVVTGSIYVVGEAMRALGIGNGPEGRA
ncbi:MAG: bifunctional folylpolyglutamate synthase/dihydrofolate synthase [Acidobacteria bacterium]|nr:bifunctional folylpolyglutamate synthase/dihydrofolate synthase [Acidobacteriota bacterium]